MRRLAFIFAAVLLSSAVYAQSATVAENPQVTPDSLAVVEPQCFDIFESVQVEQSDILENAFRNYVADNPSRKQTGYRVRIYFDSSRQARTVSEQIMQRFEALYPDIPVYRSYSSPFFKVTAGDFRTRDDAHRFAALIASQFPSAFLVKETINFPTLWSNKD